MLKTINFHGAHHSKDSPPSFLLSCTQIQAFFAHSESNTLWVSPRSDGLYCPKISNSFCRHNKIFCSRITETLHSLVSQLSYSVSSNQTSHSLRPCSPGRLIILMAAGNSIFGFAASIVQWARYPLRALPKPPRLIKFSLLNLPVASFKTLLQKHLSLRFGNTMPLSTFRTGQSLGVGMFLCLSFLVHFSERELITVR